MQKQMHHWISKMCPVKIQGRLRECAGWSESSLVASVRRYVFWRYGSNESEQLYTIIKPQYWDRKACANSVDPDQTQQNFASNQGLHYLSQPTHKIHGHFKFCPAILFRHLKTRRFKGNIFDYLLPPGFQLPKEMPEFQRSFLTLNLAFWCEKWSRDYVFSTPGFGSRVTGKFSSCL